MIKLWKNKDNFQVFVNKEILNLVEIKPKLILSLKYYSTWGAWVAQLVKRLTWAQVMISQRLVNL